MGMACKALRTKVSPGKKAVSRTVRVHPTRLSTCVGRNKVHLLIPACEKESIDWDMNAALVGSMPMREVVVGH